MSLVAIADSIGTDFLVEGAVDSGSSVEVGSLLATLIEKPTGRLEVYWLVEDLVASGATDGSVLSGVVGNWSRARRSHVSAASL